MTKLQSIRCFPFYRKWADRAPKQIDFMEYIPKRQSDCLAHVQTAVCPSVEYFKPNPLFLKKHQINKWSASVSEAQCFCIHIPVLDDLVEADWKQVSVAAGSVGVIYCSVCPQEVCIQVVEKRGWWLSHRWLVAAALRKCSLNPQIFFCLLKGFFFPSDLSSVVETWGISDCAVTQHGHVNTVR